MKKILHNLYNQAGELNNQNILNLLEKNKDVLYLDLGCDDGRLTKKFAKKINTKNIFGVDIVDKKIKLARKKKIKVSKFDLNSRFAYNSNFFDCITANQIIEHLYNSDIFISEIYRVLKPNGYAIISTENASSWCNIISSIFGWQIFSLTNFSSKKGGIGNPFALYRENKSYLESFKHVRIYNIRGLKEYFEIFGFSIEKIKGAGYFPLPAILGKIDKIHSHFMTFKIRKKNKKIRRR